MLLQHGRLRLRRTRGSGLLLLRRRRRRRRRQGIAASGLLRVLRLPPIVLLPARLLPRQQAARPRHLQNIKPVDPPLLVPLAPLPLLLAAAAAARRAQRVAAEGRRGGGAEGLAD
jgi:hypothetical protein